MDKEKMPDLPIGEILTEEFLKPLGISVYRLAKEIKVPVSRIQDIIEGRRRITMDTALRLAAYFGTRDMYFVEIQNRIDLQKEKQELKDVLPLIKPILSHA